MAAGRGRGTPGARAPRCRVNRGLAIIVAPDPHYFRRLASAHGDEADRAFFDALESTYPEADWPVYIEHQTDYSGCVRFGSMSLLETYRVWTDFQRKYPERYATAAKKEVEALLETLTASTCACGGLEAVQAEFQRFIQMFPDSPARREVEHRLDDVRASRSKIRADCISG